MPWLSLPYQERQNGAFPIIPSDANGLFPKAQKNKIQAGGKPFGRWGDSPPMFLLTVPPSRYRTFSLYWLDEIILSWPSLPSPMDELAEDNNNTVPNMVSSQGKRIRCRGNIDMQVRELNWGKHIEDGIAIYEISKIEQTNIVELNWVSSVSCSHPLTGGYGMCLCHTCSWNYFPIVVKKLNISR